MELGQRLLKARQEKGLSQRQLCADVITRNMLSQIEHGTARPSMDTLRYLAGKLEKPISYFLEEDVVLSSNQPLMQAARQAWKAGDAEKTRQLLQQYTEPDETFQWEWQYLTAESTLLAAEQAIAAGKRMYARQLLEEAASACRAAAGLERKRLVLLARLPDGDAVQVAGQLPSLDEELLVHAQAALTLGNPDRAAGLLGAVQNQNSHKWNLLMGKTCLLQKQYARAASCLEAAEKVSPRECWPLLEICFRELGDFQKAYVYACKQK